MRAYYKRFGQRFWRDITTATGEQVLGAALTIVILICQIHFGVIKQGEVRANFLSIAWPYAALLGVLCLKHLVRTPHHLDSERQGHIDGLSVRLRASCEEIERLTTEPDIGGEILAVFWEPYQDPYSTSENVHSHYYVKLRLVNRNNVSCTIDEYRILVNSIYGDQPCQGKGRPSVIGKLRHPTSAYQDEMTFTESSPVAIAYDKSPKPPVRYQEDTWTQTRPLDIPRYYPLEHARAAEGWITFEVGNYIPHPVKPEDIRPKEYLAFAPWQQNITIIVVDSLGKGEHPIDGDFVGVAPSTFSVD
jgi:hypothetical protein